MVSHYLLCSCSEVHVIPNSYIFWLMNTTMHYVSPGELLFSLANCCSGSTLLQSCSIDFYDQNSGLSVDCQKTIGDHEV